MICPIHGIRMTTGPACDPAPACFECHLATPAPKPPKAFKPGHDVHGRVSLYAKAAK